MRIGNPMALTRQYAASGASTQLLGELDADALLLERREVFDEDLAAQVIHFVLDADRQQTLRFHRQGISAGIIGTNPDPIGAFDDIVNPRHRETTLFDIRDAPALDD